jgi:hypothetical protein
MGFSTFSGPIRSGTQRYGAGRNTGLAVLTQSKTIDMAGVALTSAPPAQDLFTLPAGSKIVSIIADKTVALTGNSVSQVALIVGNASDDNQYLESVNLATTKGRAAQATVDAGLQVDDCDNIGTSDVMLQATFTATTGNPTAGQIIVTVVYVQRTADGSANPTEFQN